MINDELLLYFLWCGLLATLGHCTDLQFRLPAVTYVCERTGELNVVWPAPSNETRVKICLYNLNIRDSKPNVLTEMSMVNSLSDGLQHVVFKIPPDLLHCKYYYQWKMEAFLPGLTPQPTECLFDTPYEKCELAIGKSNFCPYGWMFYSLPIECESLPRRLRFLPEGCHRPPPPPPPTEPPRVAIAASVSVTVTLLAAIALVLYLRLKPVKSGCGGDHSAFAEPVASAFKLPDSQWQRFLRAKRDAAMPHPGIIGVDYLLLNPDTGVALISAKD